MILDRIVSSLSEPRDFEKLSLAEAGRGFPGVAILVTAVQFNTEPGVFTFIRFWRCFPKRWR